jgi:hypothetical protein
MRDLQPHPGIAAGAQRFRHRLYRARVALARVRGIERAGTRDLAAKTGDLLLTGVGFGRVFKAGGQAEGAFLQPPHTAGASSCAARRDRPGGRTGRAR